MPRKPNLSGAARREPQLLVVVSDLHAGSTVGLCPPDCPLLDDGCWTLNPVQAWIWGLWQEWLIFVRSVVENQPFALLVNGDAIEGVHHKSKQVVHADPGVHGRIASMLLRPLASKACATYMVRGTEAHVGHSAECGIGEAIGAEVHPDTGVHAAHHWLIEIAGCLVSAKHHIGTSQRLGLQATQLGMQLAEEQLACHRAGHRVPQVVIRSHRHTFGEFTEGRSMLVTTPAWQALTSFGWKVVPSAIPQLGGVVLDWRGSTNGLPRVLPFVRYPSQPAVAVPRSK